MIKQIAIRATNEGINKVKRITLRYVFSYILAGLAIFFLLLALAELVVAYLTFLSRAEIFMFTALILLVLSVLIKRFWR
jgi:hypothetical protein